MYTAATGLSYATSSEAPATGNISSSNNLTTAIKSILQNTNMETLSKDPIACATPQSSNKTQHPSEANTRKEPTTIRITYYSRITQAHLQEATLQYSDAKVKVVVHIIVRLHEIHGQ